MEKLQLGVREREKRGKGSCKKLRRDGIVPAILYGGEDNIPLMINSKKLLKALETAAGMNIILNLRFEDGRGHERLTIIKDLQRHPLRRDIVHVDLMEVSMDREIIIKVKVRLVGEPVGVKQKGGMLSQQMREMRLTCLADRIPNEITVEVSHLDVGDAIHIKDILAGEGIKILESPEATVASVSMLKAEEVKAEAAVAAAPAEAGVTEPPEEKAKE
ncbi:MAG: 50S ribosomal protein L25 [Nitrospinae bacterium]|nr:50S ribosomal protein L25 [Nitrospinota bacterium]